MAEGADTAKAVALAADLTRDTPILAPTGSGFSVKLSDANQAADVLIALGTTGSTSRARPSNNRASTTCSWP
jgi:hypothetical protein